jgi:hypothetical protein
MVVDLSLNSSLYNGCQIETVGGRQNLTTPIPEAIEIVGTNIARAVGEIPRSERESVVLTGPMAVWSYLVVFHAVVHAFTAVYYDDGRTGPVLIAKHG